MKSFVQFWMHLFGIRVFFVCIRECNASHQSLRQLSKVYMFLGGLKPPLEQVRLRLHVHKLLSSNRAQSEETIFSTGKRE